MIRTPEHYERAVIGSILVDAQSVPPYQHRALALARLQLQPVDFLDTDCRTIYEAMIECDSDGLPVDVVTLAPYLEKRGWLDTDDPGSDGDPYMFLWDVVNPEHMPCAANVEMYVRLVAGASARRQIAELGQWQCHQANDMSTPINDVLDASEDRLAEARERVRDHVGEYDLAAAVERARARLSTAGEWRWKVLTAGLDGYFGGIGQGQQWVIGGRSGHMKTALAVNIAWQTMQAGHRVLINRYEESEDSMLLRLASLESGESYGAMQREQVAEQAMANFDAGLKGMVGKYGNLLRCTMGLSFARIEGIVAEWKPALVIYDTIQAMADQLAEGSDRRRDLQVQRVCQHAARLCAMPDAGHAAILISQLQKGRGQPTMAELRESGAIEEAADVVLLLHWPYKEDSGATRNQIILRVGKNRLTGQLGIIKCAVDPGTQRFGQLADEGD